MARPLRTMKSPQKEAGLVDRLRDHETELGWLSRSLLSDSDSDMELMGARVAAVAKGQAVVREAIAALAVEEPSGD